MQNSTSIRIKQKNIINKRIEEIPTVNVVTERSGSIEKGLNRLETTLNEIKVRETIHKKYCCKIINQM